MTNIIQFPGNPSIHEDPDLDPKEMLGVLREEVTMTEAMVIGWTDAVSYTHLTLPTSG